MANYLKIDRIDGDVTAKGHEKWIAIESIDFEVKRILSTDPGRIADREGTRPAFSEVTFKKKVDRSSPLLFNEACVGKAKKTIQCDICQTGDTLSPYTQFTLYNGIISGYEFNATPNETDQYPTETITISFDKIEFRYTPYDSENTPQSPIPAGYDLKAATAI